MPLIGIFRSPAAVVLTIVACAAAAPLQSDNIGLSQAVYTQPELAEALARTYEALGHAEPHNVQVIGDGHLMRQVRTGLDSLSGATFGESKRFESRRKQNDPYKQNGNWTNMMNRVPFDGSAKRNFDEIDRTNFDSFVKRNFDEIDRTGWNSFVKRRFMDAYLASRQR